MAGRAPPSYCVVGGGTIGSWTALHLARAGVDTTLIEQFPLPSSRGSSHGATRVFRFLGDDDPTALEYSLAQWHQLEAEGATNLEGDGVEEGNGKLFVQTGLINFGPSDDPYLHRHKGVLDRTGHASSWVDAKTIARRFPHISYPPDWDAVSDPGGGILLAHKCVTAVQARFVALGGKLVHAAAQSVENDAGADAAWVTMRHPGGKATRTRFHKVVVCAGPWTGKLLPALSPVLRTVLIPVTYFKEKTPPAGEAYKYSVASGFPVLFNARLTNIYGVPSYEYPGLVKVLSHVGPDSDPDTRDEPDIQPFIDHVCKYVEEHLPLLEHARPAIVERCMYTCTPDDTPIMDAFASNVVIGCGYSGSGFKHSPASGHMLSALALGTSGGLPEGYRLAKYTLARFGSPPRAPAPPAAKL